MEQGDGSVREKYLGVVIDSESYSGLMKVFDASEERVRLWLESHNDDDEAEVEWSNNRCSVRNGDYFQVGTMYRIPSETRFVVLWWHAYDGVDFEIKGLARTKKEAIKIYNEVVDKMLANYEYDEYDNSARGYFVGDTGTEWEVLKVVRI